MTHPDDVEALARTMRKSWSGGEGIDETWDRLSKQSRSVWMRYAEAAIATLIARGWKAPSPPP